MGLEEKRKTKEIQDGILKTTSDKVKEVVGVAIPIEVDWATFSTVAGLEGLQHNGLTSLIQAIEEIAKDNLGKDALKESLKKVVFKNKPGNDDPKATFENGVLTNESSFDYGSYAGYGMMSSVLSAKL